MTCPPPPRSGGGRTIHLEAKVAPIENFSCGKCPPCAGGEKATLSLVFWGFGGQPEYAAAQQPFLSGGALHPLVAPCARPGGPGPVTEVGDYQDLALRWPYTPRARAPGAMAQLVVSKVDLLNAGEVDFISNWLFERVSRGIDDWKKISSSFGPLLQPGVLKPPPVGSGLFNTAKAARKHIITLCKPEDLPAVGMQAPNSWWGVADATEATRANEAVCAPHPSIKKGAPAEFRGVTEGAWVCWAPKVKSFSPAAYASSARRS